MTPTVSVVMAVKNGARFVGRAIESVLAQDGADLEIVVVDKASLDGSAEIAASYPNVTVLQQAGSGFQGAWNEGIAASTGELVAILDCDDVWLPGKLAAQIALLEGPPSAEWCFTRSRFMAEPGHRIPPGFRREQFEGDHATPIPSALLIRRRALAAYGVFREDLAIASDVEWYARLRRSLGAPSYVDSCLVEKRFHDTNLSANEAEDLNRELIQVLRENIARRAG